MISVTKNIKQYNEQNESVQGDEVDVSGGAGRSVAVVLETEPLIAVSVVSGHYPPLYCCVGCGKLGTLVHCVVHTFHTHFHVRVLQS